ncbi:hypothetical protein [Streptomyces capitiformicae]|uniref:hypothetical protein n=1 Tax=Streptomyces capitiformicae TaxID=2014920 RepID=UPI001676AA96|nr:hypothetical protein [Streptomyces capitiformicae]
MPTWFWFLALGLLVLAFFISLSASLMAFITTHMDTTKSIHDAISTAGSAIIKTFTLMLAIFGFILTLIAAGHLFIFGDAAATPQPNGSSTPSATASPFPSASSTPPTPGK